MRLRLGVDVGSVSLKLVLMEGERLLEERYLYHRGRPLELLAELLEELLPAGARVSLYCTGRGGKLVAELLGGTFVNEVMAQARAALHFFPEVRTLLEMGGEEAKLVFLADQRVVDFELNDLCAAGTGSFLEEQALRLGMGVEELGRLALRCQRPPRIAGRCSVFAKTDVIHLQQQAAPLEDIAAGLCFAVARNVRGSLVRGRPLAEPVCFQGGVAANPGVRRALQEVLGVERLLVPERFATSGALGAILEGGPEREFRGLEGLRAYLRTPPAGGGRPPLVPPPPPPTPPLHRGRPPGVFLGIDVGSVSTNVVALDPEGRLLAKRYLPTAGRPLEAIRRGLREVGEELGGVEVLGVGTTGSGRYLTGDFVGADVVVNEITAQARAAVFLDPEVDTVFEIGGQDSKYIALEDGVVVDFEMNKVCAAGTGSFLEEQAELLGTSIQEFGRLALSARHPVDLGERCTVFMHSNLVNALQRGADRADLAAGLCYSVALNYLNRVVGRRRVGQRVLFQGGTAANPGVVAAFRQLLGREVIVPPHHEVTGAIGAALLARSASPRRSAFRGFELAERPYRLVSFTCQHCPNACEINRLELEGRVLTYGGRCERHERRQERAGAGPDLFEERRRALHRGIDPERPGPPIGIPRCLLFQEWLPLWGTLLQELGFRVVLSEPTNRRTLERALEAGCPESCLPLKAAHGHLLWLRERGVERILVPSVVELPGLKGGRAQLCPYVQAFPYLAEAVLGMELVRPAISLLDRRRAARELARWLGASERRARRALEVAWEAQREFWRAMRRRGQEVLGGLEGTAVVVVGRPYNAADPGMNLNLARRLRGLGVTALPLEMLPLEEADFPPEMYWHYGQRILAAADYIARHPHLQAIYLTNFACGPDSFIQHFFRRRMGGRPFLTLEVDEHTSDVGMVTRLEAFLDSLRARRVVPPPAVPARQAPSAPRGLRGRRVLVPYMDDHARAFAAALRACGVEAEALPPSDEETLRLGRAHTSGRECYPCILTTGDLIKSLRARPAEPLAFCMPSGSGPCRFGQYHHFQRLLLEELGYPVPIFSPLQDLGMYQQLDREVADRFAALAWEGIAAVDVLKRLLLEFRPGAPREAQALYERFLRRICELLERGRPLEEALAEAAGAFRALGGDGPRPRVGVVGEIYIRSNPFGNEQLVRRLEEQGARVWLSSVSEWVLYVNFVLKRRARQRRRWRELLRLVVVDFLQRRRLRALERAAGCEPEPEVDEVVRLASPWLHPSFEGEAILTVGRALDFARRGACGIVSAMPFGCMPGTIAGSILERLCRRRGVAWLNMVFDGQGDLGGQVRLEAFMQQVRQRWSTSAS